MSIRYKVVKQAFGFDKSKTPKYVVRPVTGEMVNFNQVRKQVTQICGAHRGTVNLVIDALLDVLQNHLEMSHSVQLGEFGTLRPALRAKAQDNEEAATADTVYRRRIHFMPGKQLRGFLNEVSFSRVHPVTTDYTDGSSEPEGGL